MPSCQLWVEGRTGPEWGFPDLNDGHASYMVQFLQLAIKNKNYTSTHLSLLYWICRFACMKCESLRGYWTWNQKNCNTYLSCHNFFSPFFCAYIFDTSLLLIVCALKWYIKSLYRHLFLEDISTHARVTQKIDFLIGRKLYSQEPWPQRPKLGVRVAKALSCDRMDSLFYRWTPPSPRYMYSVQKRRTTEICVGGRQNSLESASLKTDRSPPPKSQNPN